MTVLYLTGQGDTLRKSGDRLIVEDAEGSERLEIECRHLEAVLVFGNVQFTTQALAELLEHGIEFALLSSRGGLRGQLTPPCPGNIALRQAQWARLGRPGDPTFKLHLARRLVAIKLEGARELLADHHSNHPAPALADARKQLAAARDRAATACDPAQLLGIEGAAARAYFDALKICCRGELAFAGRSSRPPRDPMNALLSFGYTLLAQELRALLDAVGLEPHLGAYHQTAHGRPALALDLLEELRHPLVDRLALRLNNLRKLKPDDFREQKDGGWRLQRPALRRFLADWNAWLEQPRHGAPGGRAWRDFYRRRVELLARCLREGGDYPAWDAATAQSDPEGEAQDGAPC